MSAYAVYNGKESSIELVKPKQDEKKKAQKRRYSDKDKSKMSATKKTSKKQKKQRLPERKRELPNWQGPPDAVSDGIKCLESLLDLNIAKFEEKYFEKRPYVSPRTDSCWPSRIASEWLTSEELWHLLDAEEPAVYYDENITVSEYVDDERLTHTPIGRCTKANVEHFYEDEGCSLRLLNPQKFFPKVWEKCYLLQQVFHCWVGANIYLTPPKSQGFAPHFDDIEAFVVQLEGTKTWTVYPPINDQHTLPRYSSRSFKRADLDGHKAAFTITLNPGDLMYFPRGWIHEAHTNTKETRHSLHITVSAYQQFTIGNMLGKVKPTEKACSEWETSRILRQGLPLQFFGRSTVAESSDVARVFYENCKLQGNRSSKTFDKAVDMLKADFMHYSLPPPVRYSNKGYSASVLTVDSLKTLRVRLTQRYCAMLTVAGNTDLVKLSSKHGISPQSPTFLWNCHNGRDYGEKGLEGNIGFMVSVTDAVVDVFEQLQNSFPHFVKLNHLETFVKDRNSCSFDTSPCEESGDNDDEEAMSEEDWRRFQLLNFLQMLCDFGCLVHDMPVAT